MKPVIPNQHGAWSMLLIPFLFGITAGSPTLYHLALLIAWLFIYLASYPFLLYIKQTRKKHFLHWALLYGGIAALFGGIALLHEWKIVWAGAVMIPLFFVNMYFAKKKKERALLNDISAIVVFCTGGVVSYYFGTGEVDATAWSIFTVCFLFFMGSTFYVKTMIREKNNSVYRTVSWTYHILLVAGTIFVSPVLAVAFIPSLIRAIAFYGKNMPVLKVGIFEIANSVYFFLAILFAMNPL